MERDRQNICKAECLSSFESLRYKAVVEHGIVESSRFGIKISKLLSVIVLHILIIQVSFAIEAETKDYGVVGHTYEIQEQDIIEYIKNRLGKIDLKTLEGKTRARVKEKVRRPVPVSGIIKAKETHEYYYDPTFVLEEDIVDYIGKIIHPRGTTINPLSRINMREALIFIDGDDKSQTEYGISKYKELNEKVKIILINGSPTDLMIEHKNKIEFYFDQDGVLTNKLGIKRVPAIVNQDGLKLKVTEVALK